MVERHHQLNGHEFEQALGVGDGEEGSGWGTCVYLWQIHFDIWQNQYNIVKFKNIIKLKKQQQQ